MVRVFQFTWKQWQEFCILRSMKGGLQAVVPAKKHGIAPQLLWKHQLYLLSCPHLQALPSGEHALQPSSTAFKQ